MTDQLSPQSVLTVMIIILVIIVIALIHARERGY